MSAARKSDKEPKATKRKRAIHSSTTKLMASLGIASENVLALGDGENDVEMLEWAGTSVAMASAATGSRGNLTGLTPESQGNAGPQALAAADWRVGTNDEGGWCVPGRSLPRASRARSVRR